MPADDSAPPPALSILSAAHGAEPHLAEMIGSVLAQTVDDWELIVVDNGMSDEVVRIVAEHPDPRIRLLRQEYRGLAGAVDAAAAVARGAYYAVQAGDGRLDPTFCERVGAVLAEHPEIDVLCVDALPFLDGEDRPPSFRQRCGITGEPGVGHRVGLVEVVRRSGLYTTAAVRASTWRAAGGFRGDAPPLDSLAMCLRILAAGHDLRVLPEQLGRYRLNPDDVDEAPPDRAEYDAAVQRAFGQLTTLTDDPQVLAEVRRTLRAHRYESELRTAREALANSDPGTARRHAWRALTQRPALRPALFWVVLRVAPGGLGRLKAARRRLAGARGR